MNDTDYDLAMARIAKQITPYDDDPALIYEARSDMLEFGPDKKIAIWINPESNRIEDYTFVESFNEFEKQVFQLAKDDNLMQIIDPHYEPEEIVDGFWDKYNLDDIYKVTFQQLIILLEIQDVFINKIHDEITSKNRERAKKAAKARWAKASAEDRTKSAKKRGKIGGLKRWGKLDK